MSFTSALDSAAQFLGMPAGMFGSEEQLPAPFEERQAIFIHIPKAAGSSVSLALFGCQVGHIPVRELYAADFFATRRLFKFTFVREPLDRLHSAFQFLQRGGINENDKAFADAHIGDLQFAEFVEKLEREPGLLGWWHLRTQQSFLCDPRRPNKVLVNFVGRYESLECDFARVCERLGLRASLPRANATEGRTEIASIDPATAARVRRIYACDYELLGYA